MKTILLLIFAMVLSFSQCKKEDTGKPVKELLNIEIIASSSQSKQIDLGIHLVGKDVNIKDSISITLHDQNQVTVYKQSFFVDRFSQVVLSLNTSPLINSSLGLYGYTKQGNKTFVLVDKGVYYIFVNDNVNQNVVIE